MKKILAIILIFGLASPLFAIEPFTITEIRVEGLEKVRQGTVFNYLPLKVGDEVDDEETRLSIRELFKSGLFKDVSLERDGTTLVVKVVERPSIASITINGNDELALEDIEAGLEQTGLIQGRIFNNATLRRVEQDLKSTYLSLGRYSASVEGRTEELDRNRVAVYIDIQEGRVARIKKINLIGVEKESKKDVLKEMKLRDRRGFALFSRKDQYSKQKLEADLEQIRSYYLDRGYQQFEIVSSSVDISPNKQNIFINITVNEGDIYKFSETTIEGLTASQAAEVAAKINIEPGENFSREQVSEIRNAILEHFATQGYAFAEVRPIFNTDNDSNTVAVVFSVILNQRVTVRRINITGNTYTRDEVIRRELRQLEGAWYSSVNVRRSRDRLQRLGIFGSVQIETSPVPGTADQLDVNVTVSERDTGSVLFSAGYSDEDGVLLGLELEQRNLFGTGKDFSLNINDSDVTDSVEISYTNPYHTPDGVSRSFSLTNRKVDAQEANTAEYILDIGSVGVQYKIPIAETNSLTFDLAYERLELEATTGTPDIFRDVIEDKPKADDLVLGLGVSRDNTDDFFFPTRGGIGSIGFETTIPGSDFEYYRINLTGRYYYSLTDRLTLKGGLGIGVGDGYGDSPELPFFKHYFTGGARSVRGFEARSLGPRDTGDTPEPIGGDTRVLVNMELLFPAFGEGATNDKRFGVFIDGGMVYDGLESVDLDELRYSAGIFFNWYSAVGPFSISYGSPFDEEEGDEIEKLQISIGTVFR